MFAIASLRYIGKKEATLTAALILAMLISAGWSLMTLRGSDAVRSLAAYLNFVLAFVTFMNLSERWQRRAIDVGCKTLGFFVCLGIAQILGILDTIDGLLSTLVPRATASALTNMGGRGVTLLSSEPSRAGVEVVYLYLLYRLIVRRRRSLIVEDVGLLVFLAVVIKAAQPFAFGVLAVGMLFVRRWYHVAFVIFVMQLAPLVHLGNSDSRIFVLLNSVKEMGLSEALFFVANESGHRLISIYAFFIYGFLNPLGGGIGSWAVSSIEAIRVAGVNISEFRYFTVHGDGNIIGIRGSGVLSNMMLDGGIILTAIFLYWLFGITKRYRTWDHVTWVIMVTLLFKISFIGSIGEPIPWVVSALVLRDNYRRRNEVCEYREKSEMMAK